jgi:hypothetical protein
MPSSNALWNLLLPLYTMLACEPLGWNLAVSVQGSPRTIDALGVEQLVG